jgi:L-serine deaminase
MAMLHHYIVAGICGITTQNYALVGDDLVIRGEDDDYNRYVRILTKIGMAINPNKTIVSKKDPNKINALHSVEFARNFIIDNYIIHPIQYGIMYA